MVKKHTPFLEILLEQIFVPFFIALFSVELYIGISGVGGVSALSIGIFLGVADATIMVLSLLLWWNVPIAIGANGIARKGETHRWEDAISITIRNSRFQTQYGVRRVMTIEYSDGQSIRLDPNKPILKDITGLCPDERFLAMLEEAEQEWSR